MESPGLMKLVRDGVNRPAKKMTAKLYVKKHLDLIFVALDGGAKYADIRAALAEDGVVIGAQYFKELMLDLKKKQYGYTPTRTGGKARAAEPAPEAIREAIRDPHTIDLIEGKTDSEKAAASTTGPARSTIDELKQKYKDNPTVQLLDGAEAVRRAREMAQAAKTNPAESVQEVLAQVAESEKMSKADAVSFLSRFTGRGK